jgi:hypothetical protein
MSHRFDERTYLGEMHQLIGTATQVMMRQHPDAVVYTASIWTDPNAAVSCVSFDTREHSDEQVRRSNEWSRKHYDRLMAEGKPDEAELFRPNKGRNCNPADFRFRNVAKVTHASFERHWEEAAGAACWNELEPALNKVAARARLEFSALRLDSDAILGINCRRDWFDQNWQIDSGASSGPTA